MRAYTGLALAVCCGLGVSEVARAGARSGDYSVQVLSETGHVLPTFQQDGRSYAMGILGHRYSLRVRNGSDRRVEFVASVDGRDVLDGHPSSWDKRGYLVNPHSEVVIDGFRLSRQAVAAFRFSSVHSSYASRTGDARDVGVIGVAVFPERGGVPVAETNKPHFWNNVWGAQGGAQEGGGAAVDDRTAQSKGAMPDSEMSAPTPQPAQASAEQSSLTDGPSPAADMAPPAPPPAPAATPAGMPAAMPTSSSASTEGLAEGNEIGQDHAKAASRGRSAMAGAPAPMRASASAPPHQLMAKKPPERPGLGTEFGERRSSQAEEVAFERASARPATVLSLHYDNKEGLLALGIDVDRRLEISREARLRRGAEPFRRNSPSYDRSPALLAR